MSLHLLKLCVGVQSIGDLEVRIAARLAAKRAQGETAEQIHTTRMMPRRRTELLDGGSLYWVIKGQVAARQTLIDIRPITDADGIARCQLVLEPILIPVMPRPLRPFQGWRYLQPQEAPADISKGTGEIGAMPEDLRRQLRELGLL
jgi:hypothetical protein